MAEGFQVKSTNNGVYMMPMLNGKTLAEDEFDKLDDNIKAALKMLSNVLSTKQ